MNALDKSGLVLRQNMAKGTDSDRQVELFAKAHFKHIAVDEVHARLDRRFGPILAGDAEHSLAEIDPYNSPPGKRPQDAHCRSSAATYIERVINRLRRPQD